MTPLEKLKELDLKRAYHRPAYISDGGLVILDLAPELIALWDAVDHDFTVYGVTSDSRTLHAIKALNAKAARVLHD